MCSRVCVAAAAENSYGSSMCIMHYAILCIERLETRNAYHTVRRDSGREDGRRGPAGRPGGETTELSLELERVVVPTFTFLFIFAFFFFISSIIPASSRTYFSTREYN
jgi:hypothetical protein